MCSDPTFSTSSHTTLSLAQHSQPTRASNFLKRPTLLPALRPCTGGSHYLGRACPRSSPGQSPLILQASAQMSAFRHLPDSPIYLDEGPPTGFLCTSASRDLVCPVHLCTSGSSPARSTAGPQ